ncbi:hypothetical protein [Rhodococcus sp. B10]|uniref:hypothetical protein n=1 Tax=Rhodococcus sp. B10 TaxID=2695876 RepID=UPI001431E2E9|nr:hypothetical protein [Rhodococcus sp. B10]NIL77583.1 hypothetical protein [Rhodococcus sp. B10]
MAVGFTTVRVNIGVFIIDGVDDDDVYDDVPASGRVIFEPMLDPGKPVQVDDNGQMKIKVVAPFTADIGLTGEISHRNRNYVTVPAPTSATSNVSQLQWKATFKDLTYGGQVLPQQPPIYFWAEPGVEINLADHVNVAPGSTAVQLSRGARGFGVVGAVPVEDAAFAIEYQTASGTELSEPIPLPEGGSGVPDEGVTEAKLAPEVRDQIASKATLTGMYPAVPLYGYGNSWMDAAGFFGALPSRFGFSLSGNRAVGGHRVQDTAITALSPGVGEWTPGSGVVVVNDLGNNLADPDDAANRGAALESARALCAILSSASKTESTGWTYSSSPAWSDTAMGYAGASGDSYAISTNDGAYVDFPVPAGTSYLTVFGGDGAAFKTGTVTVTQGGRTFTKATNEKARATTYRASLGVAPVVVRLDGMSAGTARATFTTGGVAGAVSAVDCLLTLSQTPPTIVWIKPVAVTATGYTGKTALLTYLRSIPDVLAQEFPNVVVVDPAAGWDPTTMLGPDGLHPNTAGWAHVGDAVSAALVRQSVGGLDETAVAEVVATVGDARYAPKVETAVLTRDSAGRITSAVENGVTVTYGRDSAGRIQSETKAGKITTYTRDGSGRVASWETVNA